MDYYRQNRVDIKIVRMFNTYGPRMAVDDGRVISNFIVQALRGKPLTIYGDGSQTRSFCYVSDLIQAVVKMMETEEFIGPLNLGNPKEYSILEVAEKIIKLVKSRSKIIHKTLPSDDPSQRRPDISLAADKLGWEPKIDFEEGLLETIDYFKQELNLNIKRKKVT